MIQGFSYRAPRVDLCFPVAFTLQTDTLFGLARNISENGLLVEFDQPIQSGTTGMTRLSMGRCTLEMEARVTHTQGFAAGLQFAFASDQERSFVCAVLHVLTQERMPEEAALT